MVVIEIFFSPIIVTKFRNSTTTAQGDHSILFVFDDRMINYQRIWLKFSQLIKYLLFCISYKICKHKQSCVEYRYFNTSKLISDRIWRLCTCVYAIYTRQYIKFLDLLFSNYAVGYVPLLVTWLSHSRIFHSFGYVTRSRVANFDRCSALMAIEQWGFFSVCQT